MSARLAISALALGAVMIGAGTVAYVARAKEHPQVETSLVAKCAECHMADYRRAPDHVGVKPTTCGVCHAQTSWHEKHFDHPFALSGAHERAKCFDCHTGDPAKFHGTSNLCVDCHRAEYERAPNHVGHFPTTCQECHTFQAWKPTLPAPEKPPEPPPPPPPTDTGSAPLPPPTITAKPKPKPKPKPSATTSATAVPTVPDVVTHPSRHEHEE